MDTVQLILKPNSTIIVTVAGYSGRMVVASPLDGAATIDVILNEDDPDADEIYALQPLRTEPADER